MNNSLHWEQTISIAVRVALHNIGLDALRSQEFFGTNQSRDEERSLDKAA